MKILVASGIIYSCIAAPVLVTMDRPFHACVHMIAIALAYSWWSKK
jgi:hypothetical protein